MEPKYLQVLHKPHLIGAYKGQGDALNFKGVFMFSGKVFSLLTALLTLGLSANAAVSSRYLVQFKSPAAFQSAALEVKKAQFNKKNSNGEVVLFNSPVSVTKTLNNIQMLVIETSNPLVVAALRTNPQVAMVEEEIFHPAPRVIATRGHMLEGNSVSNAGQAMEMPWGITAVKAPEAWTTTRGAGAKVVVLDTGIDLQHPAVMNQLDGVQNFTGGDMTDVTDTVGHGTHVSGTILADGVNGGLVGVAPEARLYMGKVCTELGCGSVAIASGIDWAVSLGADVVNMSLGGFFMTSAEAKALQNAEASGVVIAAASGNDYANRVSFPAAADTAFAVGAVDEKLLKADFSNYGPELDIVAPGVNTISSVPRGSGRMGMTLMDLDGKGMGEIESLPMVGSSLADGVSNTLVFAGLGKPQDFAAAAVAGKFALVSRGEIAFKDKVENALKAGAAGVIIFNNVPGILQGSVTTDGSEVAIPVMMIPQETGEVAKTALAAGTVVSASVSVTKSDYANFQGTSMATPHIAGVIALIRSANKSLTPAQIRDLIKNTATPLIPNDLNQYGAGMVNAEAAVAAAKGFVPAFKLAR